MANTGRTVATLLIGAAVGAAVGYILATDEETRKESLAKVKDQLNDWKDKVKSKAEDLKEKTEEFSQENIFNT